MNAPAPLIPGPAIWAALAGTAQGERRVYDARKAAKAGRAVGHHILSTAAGGTWDQKLKACKVIRGRMPSTDLRLFRDAARHLSWCGTTFAN